jgi:thiol-disulfide isomerase/thioredoxin
MNTKLFFGIIGLVLILGIAGGIIANKNTSSSKPGQYDPLAMHLKNVGAKFYGAFWCTHCQAQKKAFGSSAKLLPYVECSTADGSAQLQICKDEKITGYPTWKFPTPIIIGEAEKKSVDPTVQLTQNQDGTYTVPAFSSITGEIPLEMLAKWTGFEPNTQTNATSTAK